MRCRVDNTRPILFFVCFFSFVNLLLMTRILLYQQQQGAGRIPVDGAGADGAIGIGGIHGPNGAGIGGIHGPNGAVGAEGDRGGESLRSVSLDLSSEHEHGNAAIAMNTMDNVPPRSPAKVGDDGIDVGIDPNGKALSHLSFRQGRSAPAGDADDLPTPVVATGRERGRARDVVDTARAEEERREIRGGHGHFGERELAYHHTHNEYHPSSEQRRREQGGALSQQKTGEEGRRVESDGISVRMDQDFVPKPLAEDAKYGNSSKFAEIQALSSSLTNEQARLNVTLFQSLWMTVVPSPDKFLPNFRNPCWYMHTTRDARVYRKLQRLNNLSDGSALRLIAELFYMKSSWNATQRLVCLPGVFFIGFPRSGSTHLYRLLNRHPMIAASESKEPHWWTRYSLEEHFPRNVLNVLRYVFSFAPAAYYIERHSKALTMDASQSTVWDYRLMPDMQTVPRLIQKFLPNSKYIVLIREPLSRLYSDSVYLCERHWHYHPEDFEEQQVHLMPRAFHDNLVKAIESFNRCLEEGHALPLEACTRRTLGNEEQLGCGRVRLGVSLYFVHVKQWLEVIPRKHMLFLNTNDLNYNTYKLLKNVWTFLEIPFQLRVELIDILTEHTNSNKVLDGTSILPETISLAVQFFREYNHRLSDLLDDDSFSWQY